MMWTSVSIAFICFTGCIICIDLEFTGEINLIENDRSDKSQENISMAEVLRSNTESSPIEMLTEFAWIDGRYIIPNETIPFSDVFMHTPNNPDLDLVAEGERVAEQIMYDLGTLMWDLKKAHPLRVSPMRKVTFKSWRNDYQRQLKILINNLRRTRFFQYPWKMQAWVEFVMGIESLFKKHGEKWVYKFMISLPRKRKYWSKRIKDLKRRQALFMYEIQDILMPDKNQKGLDTGGQKRKKKG